MEIQRLQNGDLLLELLPEAGGRIHRLRAFGHDILRTPDDPAQHLREPFFWGSFPLVPWSNRIPEGRLTFLGRQVRLPINYEDSAIHGEAYVRPWAVDGEGSLRFDGGDFDFPWPYLARQQFRVEGASLSLLLEVTNVGDASMPAGLGIHPWFDAHSPLSLQVPATLAYPLEKMIPSGDPAPVTGQLDLRVLRPVPWGLDNLWTGLTSDAAHLVWPERRLRCRLGWTSAADHFVVASFERFTAVAAEPVTHATDGPHRLETGQPGAIDVLAAGQTLSVTYTFSFERA